MRDKSPSLELAPRYNSLGRQRRFVITLVARSLIPDGDREREVSLEENISERIVRECLPLRVRNEGLKEGNWMEVDNPRELTNRTLKDNRSSV